MRWMWHWRTDMDTSLLFRLREEIREGTVRTEVIEDRDSVVSLRRIGYS